MQHKQSAQRLAQLHIKGNPLILYNAWDAGSAKAIAKGGASAIATTSWAVAAAHGYADGESIPFAFIEQIIACITGAVDLPVSVDVEGGYSPEPQTCAANVARLLDHGVAGINFEDRVVGGKGLHPVDAQCRRIEAIRAMAEARGIALFVNARTDVYFGSGIAAEQAAAEVRARAKAYADAGASGLFVPGIVDLQAISALCNDVALPVNVMMMAGLPGTRELADAGVARISHGPSAFLEAMKCVEQAARGVLA